MNKLTPNITLQPTVKKLRFLPSAELSRSHSGVIMFRNFLVLFLAASALSLASAADLALPPGSSVSGRTASQLSEEWWQWAMSIPDEANPVRDLDGINCGVGQQGPVWFLAGGFGSSKIRRVCTIPEGKTLFFPLINMVYWPRKNDTSFTCEQAKASAALNNETALDLFAEIDGVAFAELKQYRASTTRCFDVFGRIPSNQRHYKAYPSASDGYWLAVKPLPKGHHILKFGGKYNRNSPAFGRMVQDIEYELVVQ